MRIEEVQQESESILSLPSHRKLLYTENVEVTFENGTAGSGRASYTFQLDTEKEKLHQYTAENVEMFQLDFTGGAFNNETEGQSNCTARATGSHLCGRDMYEVTYDLYGDGECKSFDCKYVVKGPAKDYVSSTRFERLE